MSKLKLFGNKSSRSRAATSRQSASRPAAQRQTGGATATATKPRTRSGLKTITIILIVLAMLEGMYFVCVYSDNAFITKWRNIYINTAMSTMNHQWLATNFIPYDIIREQLDKQEQDMADSVGVESKWDDVEEEYPGDTLSQDMAQQGYDKEQIEFYKLFWELDRDSMDDYVKKNPDVIANGWDQIQINEAGLNDDGTSIYTTMGEQVLAIDAANQVLLLRVKGSGYRGVLAVAKDPSRLSVKNSTMLGSAGQNAGVIAKNNGGILAMTGSGFIDNDGRGNGGILAGYAMSDGKGTGSHMGWSYKRLELREDNLMYIADAQSPVHPSTTDAVEFTPALIVDGKLRVDQNNAWNGLHPRACIGQSDKKEVLMLVIEGRLIDSVGTGVYEAAQILMSHNAVQAMNLDGGTSAIMWYDGEYVTRCSNTAIPEGRTLPNAFVYEGN